MKREWLSDDNLFWTDSEWDEAYQSLDSKEETKGSQQIEQMIAFLMRHYPVGAQQLKEAKAQHNPFT